MPHNSMFSANTAASLTHSSTGPLLSGGQARLIALNFPEIVLAGTACLYDTRCTGLSAAHIWKGGQNEGRLFFQLVKIFYYISLFMGVCTSMCGCVCRSVGWRTEDKFQESVLSFYHVDPGLRILVIRQSTRCCYPLSLFKKRKQANKQIFPLAHCGRMCLQEGFGYQLLTLGHKAVFKSSNV